MGFQWPTPCSGRNAAPTSGRRSATTEKKQPDVGDSEDITRESVLHNLHQLHTPERSVIHLSDALRGPAHVAKLILRQADDKASKPGKALRFNEEQLECVAAMVTKLELGFAEREDPSQHFINPAKVLTTSIFDGGSSCGKINLLVNVMVPLFQVFLERMEC